MADLARSLVDAAAEAMVGTHNDGWEPNERARLAVAAVLETLAVGAESDYACFHPERLRGLAAEVKTEEGR